MRDTVAEVIVAAQAVVDAADAMDSDDGCLGDEPEVAALRDALLTHERMEAIHAR